MIAVIIGTYTRFFLRPAFFFLSYICSVECISNCYNMKFHFFHMKYTDIFLHSSIKNGPLLRYLIVGAWTMRQRPCFVTSTSLVFHQCIKVKFGGLSLVARINEEVSPITTGNEWCQGCTVTHLWSPSSLSYFCVKHFANDQITDDSHATVFLDHFFRLLQGLSGTKRVHKAFKTCATQTR